MMTEKLIGPILLVLVALAQAVLIAWRMAEKRAEKKNGGFTKTRIECKPGHAKVCQDNKTDITILKESHKYVAKEIGEINTSIGNIWRKMNGD